MRVLTAVLAAVVLAGCGSRLTLTGSDAVATQAPGQSSGRVIVIFRDGVEAAAAARDLGGRMGAGVVHVYTHAFAGAAFLPPAGRGPEAFLSDARVRAASRDVTMRALAQTLPTGIDRIEADKNPNAAIDGNGATPAGGFPPLAIVDTGLVRSHPDLNVAGGFNARSPKADQWDDGNGHGTHVAGTAAARDNDTGVVGVAPGAPLYGVKVLSNGGVGFTSDIIAGIDWVVGRKMEAQDGAADGDPGVDFAALNMSLGGGGTEDAPCESTTDPFHLAVCRAVDAGIVVAVAAGNSADDAANHVPAAYHEAFTVSAIADFNGKGGGGAAPTCRTDEDDTLANFSNFGQVVDIAAPGVCIRSTYLRGGYATFSGTSMATPHATGAVALYLAATGRSPGRNRRDVEAIEDAIVRAGIPQSNTACGFSGDPDAFHEPLLFANAKAFRGAGACDSTAGSVSP